MSLNGKPSAERALPYRCGVPFLVESVINGDAIVGSSIAVQQETAVNWDIIKGNWAQYKGQIKAQWGRLTDDHLDVIAGQRDQLAGQIQESYGVVHDEADKQINAFQKYLKDSGPS